MADKQQQQKSLAQIVKLAFPGVADDEIVRLQRGVSPWDSMGHVVLIEMIERETSVRVDIGFSIRVRDWESLRAEMDERCRR
ncbi:MAG: hypothetical protein JNJ49_06680 [Bdellovibrionaceae bacterium]|nr:hypothetical protein [Pseudobdellovibrionaceae bacterium]